MLAQRTIATEFARQLQKLSTRAPVESVRNGTTFTFVEAINLLSTVARGCSRDATTTAPFHPTRSRKIRTIWRSRFSESIFAREWHDTYLWDEISRVNHRWRGERFRIAPLRTFGKLDLVSASWISLLFFFWIFQLPHFWQVSTNLSDLQERSSFRTFDLFEFSHFF